MFTTKFSHAAFLTLAASMAASAQTPFVIANVHSALALDVPQALDTLAFTMLDQNTPTGATNQQWVLHRPGPAIAYEIRSVKSGMVMDVPVAASGIILQQFPVNGGNNQLWQIARAAGSTGYEIVSNLEVQTNSPGSVPTYAQLAVDVPDFSTTVGTQVQVFTRNNGTNQQWHFNPLTRNSILVSASGSGIVITGYGFDANSEVCPVLESAVGLPLTTAPCIATGDGIFTYVFPVPSGYTFSSTGGYVVMAVEDQNRNVLAIGSGPGSFAARL
jgi:hypothetical protein